MVKDKTRRAWNKYIALWNSLKGWKLFVFYIVHYTIIFFLLIPFVFSAFRDAGKNFIWRSDGLPQWCTYLVYFSQTIRNGIQSLLAGNGWTFPLYDFTLGPVELDLRMEPLQFLAVFWPWDRIDILYDVLVITRYYLIGISFSIFGFYFNQSIFAILIGALSYTFCGFTLYAGIRHPFYMAAVIYLPLLVIGAEKILRNDNPILFTFMVFLALVSNVYFACMLAIVTVLYVLVRFPTLYTQDRFRKFVIMVGRLTIYGGIGVALSGVIMIPSLLQNLRTGRIGTDRLTYMNLFRYGKEYYQRFISYFIVVPSSIGSWSHLGFSVLTFPAVTLLFIKRKREDITLRILFVLMTAMMLFPTIAYIMSGFNNISNRWCFAYSFLVCAILMFELPHFIEIDKRIFTFIEIGAIVYAIICYYIIKQIYYRESTIALLIIAILSLRICQSMGGNVRKQLVIPLYLALTCLSIYHSAFLLYDADQENYVSEFTNKGQFYNTYSQSQYASFARSKISGEDSSFYRVAGDDYSRYVTNMSFYYGINGTTGYSTYYHTAYSDWNKELELAQKNMFGVFWGLDFRARLMSLDSIKYLIMRESDKMFSLYGFKEIERIQNKEKTDIILENEYVLPIGYTYDKYITRETYNNLSSIGKEEVQLQAAVLNTSPSSTNISEAIVIETAQSVPTTISETNGLVWNDGRLKVTEEDATIILNFEGIPYTETYLRIVGLDLTNGSSNRRWDITADTGETKSNASFYADAHVYTHGMKTQLLNLGYTESGYTSCTIIFPQKGTFKLEDIQIWCQPMDNYSEQVDKLREDVLEDVEINRRGLTGSISVSKDKILCISVPYSNGWTAYVDGKKTETLQINTAFMGLELEEGNHTIELIYRIPGLTSGSVLSIFGVCGLISIIVFRRKKKRNLKKI